LIIVGDVFVTMAKNARMTQISLCVL